MADSSTSIGTLEYRVEASASSAVRALDLLEKKLLAVGDVLANMPKGNEIFKDISTMARAFNSIESSAKRMSQKKAKVDIDFSKLKSADAVLEAMRDKVQGFGNHIVIGQGEELSKWLRDATIEAGALEDKLEEMLKSGADKSDIMPIATEFVQISKSIDYATQMMREYRAEQAAIGKDFTPGLDDIGASGAVKQYTNVAAEVDAAMNSAHKSVFKVSEAMKDFGSSWRPPKSWGMDRLYDEAAKLELKLEQLRAKREELEKTNDEMKLRLNEADIAQAENRITAIENRMEELGREAENASESVAKVGKRGRRSAKQAADGFGDFVKTLKSIGSHVADFGKKISHVFGGGSHRGLLGNRSLGQFIGLIVFRRLITSALRALTAGIKEGSDNLTQYSASYNAAISGITSSLNFLKNAWAAGFAPIVEVVAPYLQALVDMLANALNAVGRFMAALTGKGFAVQAVKVFSDYAKGLKGTGSAASGAKKALDEYKKTILSFDELHVLNDTNDRASGGGGGGGGGGNTTPISDMFTTVEVEADSLGGRIRKMIENSDWTGIGETIGELLAEQLGDIDWNSIQQKAKEIGENIAEFINGAVSVKSLWLNLGSTIAGFINTAIAGLSGFLDKAHFDKWGHAVGLMIGNAILGIKWKELGSTLGKAVNGLFVFLANVFETIPWGKLAENIKTSIGAFFGTLTWKDIGRSLRVGLEALLDFIIGILPSAAEWGKIGKNIAQAIVDGLIGFFNGDNAELIQKLANALKKIIMAAFVVTNPTGLLIAGISQLGFGNKELGGNGKTLNYGGIPMLSPGQSAAENPLDYIAKKISSTHRANGVTHGGHGGSFGGINDGTGKYRASVSVTMNKHSQANAMLYKEAKQNGKGTATVAAKADFGFYDLSQTFTSMKDKIATVTAQGRASSSYTGLEQSYSSGVWTKYDKAIKTLEGATSKSYTDHEEKFKNFGKDHFDAVKTIKGAIAQSFTNTESRYNKLAKKEVKATAKAEDQNGTVNKVATAYAKLFDKNVSVKASGTMTVNDVVYAQKAVRSIQAGFNNIFGTARANGGIFSGGRWHDITRYAMGGYPNESGQLFIAREAGPELVGTIGGHTAVLNNNQIVSSVAAGVYNAVVQAMANSSSNQTIYVESVLKTDNETLARAVNRGNANLKYRGAL